MVVMKDRRILVLSAALMACVTAQAGAVYKHVDEAGNVSYSDRPPSGGGAGAMQLPETPSDEARQAAAEREKRLRAEADRMTEARQPPAGKKASGGGAPETDGAPPVAAGESGSEGYYPAYRPSLRPRPPVGSGGGAEHPIYTAPGERPTQLPARPPRFVR